jgi:hypothetical protein
MQEYLRGRNGREENEKRMWEEIRKRGKGARMGEGASQPCMNSTKALGPGKDTRLCKECKTESINHSPRQGPKHGHAARSLPPHRPARPPPPSGFSLSPRHPLLNFGATSPAPPLPVAPPFPALPIRSSAASCPVNRFISSVLYEGCPSPWCLPPSAAVVFSSPFD